MGKDRVAPESNYVVADETKNGRKNVADDVDVSDVDGIKTETETETDEIRASNQNSEDDPGNVTPTEDEPLPPMRNQADIERWKINSKT